MGCSGTKMVAVDQQITNCIDNLQKRPDLMKFKRDQTILKNIENCYDSKVYGGSIFLPIGSNEC